MYLYIDKFGGAYFQTDKVPDETTLEAVDVIELSEDGFFYPYGSAEPVPYVPYSKYDANGWPTVWSRHSIGNDIPKSALPGYVQFNGQGAADFGNVELAASFAMEARNDKSLTVIEWGNRITGQAFSIKRKLQNGGT